jgi:uncharacterized protein YggE
MSTPLVTVRGEAQLEVPPDRATISVTTQASADTAERVRAQLADASVRLTGLLSDFTLGVVESSTTGLHVAPVFHRRSPGKITGYSGTFSTQVVVGDFEVLSPLVLALAQLPAVQVDGPWWSLSRGHSAPRDARIAAIADARTRAADYAAAVDATVGPLVEISDLDGGFGGRPMMASRAAAFQEMDAPEFDLTPASQTVSGQVTVRFELELGAGPE